MSELMRLEFWQDMENGKWYSTTPIGQYVIEFKLDKNHFQVLFWPEQEEVGMPDFVCNSKDLEGAEAAARNHFQALIEECHEGGGM